jgi:Flp pilus assembly protein TadD
MCKEERMPRVQVIFCTLIILTLCAAPGFSQKATTSSDAQAEINKALADLAAWNTKAAQRTLQKNKAAYGSTPQYKTAMALLELQQGGDKNKQAATKASKDLGQAAKGNTSDPVASYYEGEIFYQQSKNKEANAAWQTAAKSAGKLVSADPTDATAQYYLGAALVRTKKFGPARDALRLAVRGGFDPAMVNYQIGLSYLFAEQWQQAIDAFNLGLAVEPRFAHMYYWRGLAWDKVGRKDNMLLDLDQFLKLAPNAPEAGKARSILKSAS